MLNKAGKVWGSTQRLFARSNIEIHRIEVRAEAHCSKHCHKSKYNAFYVERGKLRISVWKNEYDLVDQTVLGPGEYTEVEPGEYHDFHAVEETVAYEIYWTQLDPKDIERENVGGK